MEQLAWAVFVLSGGDFLREFVIAIVLLSIPFWIYLFYRLAREENDTNTNKNKYIGSFVNKGEKQVDKVLKNLAKNLGGTHFIDILLKYNGSSTQIDNILVTNKAVYVIESKDYSGWIFGSQRNQNWTQTFSHYKSRTSGNNYTKSGVSKYSFLNPIKQNDIHINMLKRMIIIDYSVPIINIVVFGQNATLKEINHEKSVYVIVINQLNFLINRIDKSLTKLIHPVTQEQIIKDLYQYNHNDIQSKVNHVNRIRNKYGGWY